jgi:uncharacterized RDD family membrane protein YckC
MNPFVEKVATRLPRPLPGRAEILRELAAAVAEHLESGTSQAELEERFGRPDEVAASYGAAWELQPAPHLRRLAAKAFDLTMVLVLVAATFWLISRFVSPEHHADLVVAAALAAVGLFSALTIFGELYWSATPGKALCRLAVVRSDGTRIDWKQALLRFLPVPLQVFWLDAASVLFTSGHQRAVELITRTRVVAWPHRGMESGRD